MFQIGCYRDYQSFQNIKNGKYRNRIKKIWIISGKQPTRRDMDETLVSNISSGKKKQKTHSIYDLIVYIPVDVLTKSEQA